MEGYLYPSTISDRWKPLGPETPARVAGYSGVGPETPDTFRGTSGQAPGRHHTVHTSWRAGDSGQRDRRLRCRAATPRPGGVLSMTLQKPGDSGHRGRILRPPGDSGPPPVVLRTDTREAPHMWRRAGKSRGRRLRPVTPETPARNFPATRKLCRFFTFW